MRYYPTVPSRRAATVAADVLIVLLIALFAGFAVTVHTAVGDLAGIATGLERAGADAQAALESAASRVGGVPLVGDELAQALRDTGRQTGGDAVALGRSGRQNIEDTADVLAWSLFLIPTALVLVGYGPSRYAQAQRLTAAFRVLGDGAAAAEHPRLVAMRAAFALPYPVLLRHTDDPFGDLERGRYEALVAAAYEEAGLRRRRRPDAYRDEADQPL